MANLSDGEGVWMCRICGGIHKGSLQPQAGINYVVTSLVGVDWPSALGWENRRQEAGTGMVGLARVEGRTGAGCGSHMSGFTATSTALIQV